MAARNARSAAAPIVIEPPGYVELGEVDRREAVAALADLLATWWDREQTRHRTVTPEVGLDLFPE